MGGCGLTPRRTAMVMRSPRVSDEPPWTVVEGIAGPDALLRLARSLGSPVRLPDGTYCRSLAPRSRGEAPRRTFSKIHGRGVFPLHTDTAFWPTPARFVLLAHDGDGRRQTTLCSFDRFLADLGPHMMVHVSGSVWRVPRNAGGFYCSMRFRVGNRVGWRYDPHNMIPVNRAARSVSDALRERAQAGARHQHDWGTNTALVVRNWSCLHGRASEPPDEGPRTIHRIYVR